LVIVVSFGKRTGTISGRYHHEPGSPGTHSNARFTATVQRDLGKTPSPTLCNVKYFESPADNASDSESWRGMSALLDNPERQLVLAAHVEAVVQQ